FRRTIAGENGLGKYASTPNAAIRCGVAGSVSALTTMIGMPESLLSARTRRISSYPSMRGMFRSVTIAPTAPGPPSRMRNASTADGAISTSRPGIPRKAISSMAALFSESSTIRTTDILLLSPIRTTPARTYWGETCKFEWRKPPSHRTSRHEAIPDPVHGEKMTRRVAVRLQFLPQLHHVRVHRPRIRKKLVSPNRIQNHVARQRTVRIVHEIGQQIVFRRRQLEIFALALHDAAFKVHFDLGEVDHLARVAAGAAQHGANACHQLARAKRLHHVIVGADFQQQHLIDFIAQCAQHDYRRGHPRRPQLLADLGAAHPRQAQIHQHQVGLQGKRDLEAFTTVASLHRAKSILFQHHPDRVAQAFVVVDHENRLHGWLLPIVSDPAGRSPPGPVRFPLTT